MAVYSLDDVTRQLENAAGRIYANKPRVRAVGILGDADQGYRFGVIENSDVIVPLNADVPLDDIDGIPVEYFATPGEIEPTFSISEAEAADPAATSFIPERQIHRPLVIGLQIQNFDDDVRQGHPANGVIVIGTLGCVVQLNDTADQAILSNNHVIAGENDGINGSDRIHQAGSTTSDPAQHVATLTRFVTLKTSPPGALPAIGNVVFNELDAAVATIANGVGASNAFLAVRSTLPTVSGTATAKSGDRVFKVGRTTGLTRGTVRLQSTVVGPVPYRPGLCWFQRSFSIVGDNGTQFSDKGDSGSGIYRDDGTLLGILYAGNGTDTFACPIDSIQTELDCTF